MSGQPLASTKPGPSGIESAHPDGRANFYAAPGQQWWLVIVLLIVSTLATIDRQVIALLVNPIREHLQITDTQISLVIGAGFAIANTLFTLPAGYFADRSSRRALIVAGALVWSLMTMACGAAGSFVQLLLARAGVGFGESVIQPCALSMLSAALSPERRGRGFAVQSMAFMGGSALALIVGGILIGHFTVSGPHELPILGAVRPWQLTLIVVGLVGIPAAGLLLTVREPARPTLADAAAGGYVAALVMIRARWKVYIPLFVFQLTMTMLSLSYAAWLAAMIERLWHLSIRQIGLSLGLMMLVLPPIGLWTAGQAMDFAAARRGPRGPVLVGLIATALVAVAASAAPLSLQSAALLGVDWCLDAGQRDGLSDHRHRNDDHHPRGEHGPDHGAAAVFGRTRCRRCRTDGGSRGERHGLHGSCCSCSRFERGLLPLFDSFARRAGDALSRDWTAWAVSWLVRRSWRAHGRNQR